jgi:serine/threonine protein phosphatase 1
MGAPLSVRFMVELLPAPGRLPPGRRIYAIGDIHGCDAAFVRLHAAIAADLDQRPIPAPLVLHIGDYVDRGPDSAAVISRLTGRDTPLAPLPTINLMGNHEHTMLEALEGDRAARTDWLFQGGRPTLQSYQLDPDGSRDRWAGGIPPEHIGFLRNLAMHYREGDYIFVHAGVRPGIAFEAQVPEDLLRIRQPFLYTEQALGGIVVHGHTPTKRPVVRTNRIGIDTGAVFGGRLTCAVLEEGTIGFIAV